MRNAIVAATGFWVIFAVAALPQARVQSPDGGAAPTFSKDVAPILHANCTTCHRSGEIAPMPFDDL